MKLHKFLHSCILIESGAERLLIDPGEFSFVEGLLSPEDLPPIDIVLLTHEHGDHYNPDILRTISLRKKPHIVTHKFLQAALGAISIDAEVLAPGEKTVR